MIGKIPSRVAKLTMAAFALVAVFAVTSSAAIAAGSDLQRPAQPRNRATSSRWASRPRRRHRSAGRSNSAPQPATTRRSA